MSNKRGALIFIGMQIFFVIFGFTLFYSLKALKEKQLQNKQDLTEEVKTLPE